MKIISFIAEHAVLLLALFAIGCGVSFVRAFHKNISARRSRLLHLLEWCLLPPGFAALFITLHHQSVRYFALHPQWAVAACLGAAALSAFLIIEMKRKRRPFLGWLGGLLGVPGAAFSLVLLGLFFQSPQKFEAVRTTYLNVAATEGKPAPDFSFTLLSNREQRQLADYRGQVVLLNIWATWCAPCLKEMPDLDTLQKRFGSAGLVVINLSDERLEVIDKYLSRHPMATTHGRVERSEFPDFYQLGGARPTTFLIGADGEVIESIVGARDLDYFERMMKKARL